MDNKIYPGLCAKPRLSSGAKFALKGLRQDARLVAVLIVALIVLLAMYHQKAQEAARLELVLSRTNAAYDRLYEYSNEQDKVIELAPWLKLEWELKNDPGQVRGADGKFPRERY
jgi:hypothetical protein